MSNDLAPPPKDEDSENAVLGSIIIEGSLIETVSCLLTPDDFYKTANNKIYRSMLEMYNDNKPIDLLTLSEYLRSKGCNEEIGGSNYLTYLTEVPPTTANNKYYAGLVKKSSDLRKISQFSERLNQDIKAGKTDFKKARNRLSEFVSTLSRDENKVDILRLSDEPVPESRQWILDGLIPKGFPTTVYAGGGSGKSYLAVFLGIQICLGDQKFQNKSFYKKPLNTLFLDYELDKIEISRRSKEISNGLGLDCIPENFFYYSPELRISKLINELPRYINENDIEFIIIDSMGSGGLDAMDEKSVINTYSKLRELGISTLIVDHQSKIQTQDNPDVKSPYGSVYKTNMSRSVIHLVHERKNQNGFTARLVHKKVNFGQVCDEQLIDFIFDEENNAVYIVESTSISNKQKQMLMIQDFIIQSFSEGKEIIQTDLIDAFKGSISRDKIRSLANEGNGKYWNISKSGINNSKIYVPLSEAAN